MIGPHTPFRILTTPPPPLTTLIIVYKFYKFYKFSARVHPFSECWSWMFLYHRKWFTSCIVDLNQSHSILSCIFGVFSDHKPGLLWSHKVYMLWKSMFIIHDVSYHSFECLHVYTGIYGETHVFIERCSLYGVSLI